MFRQCEKSGSKGLSGMKCRIDYAGGIEDGLIEVVDQIRHKVIVYLVKGCRVVSIPSWDVEEVNQKQRRLANDDDDDYDENDEE